MSNTIEIPRLLAWRLAGLDPNYTTAQLDADEEELRALLAAPVVERPEPVACIPCGFHGVKCSILKDCNTSAHGSTMALVDHPANGDHIAMEATIAQMAQRIADLERRRGEPVMKLEAERLWGGAGEYAVSFVKAGWLDECRRTGGEFMLYAEQSAPVAVVNLRNFANAMIDIALEGCDADGAQIQELAVEHGLLKPEHRTERCGDACSCAEYADFPVECFRKADELNQSRAS